MSIVQLLTFSGAAEDGTAFVDWLRGEPLSWLAGQPGVRSLDLYTPAGAVSDPYLDDGAGPLATVMPGFGSLDAAAAVLGDPGYPARFVVRTGCPVAVSAAHDVMDMRFFDVPWNQNPDRFGGAVSYAVRYHRPAEDEAGFVDHYVRHHPPILADFPNIRNVICYLPVATTDWQDPTGLPSADYMLGNEVVFDSLADLDTALNSDVRHRLREDYNSFPPFTGRNTHYPMRRERLAGD